MPHDLGPRSVVAVDGIDGSGKSMLARRLVATAADAGLSAVLLSVDDFRRPVEWQRVDRSEADIYYDEYYDLPLLERCLQAFERGAASVEIPHFDPARERIDGSRTIVFGEAAMVVVEGVFVLRLPTVAAQAAIIHLVTSVAEARRRILSRDIARGRHLIDVTHRITQRYFPSQERYLRDLDPRGRASVIVDNERFDSPRIVRFAPWRFETLLRRILLGCIANPSIAPGPADAFQL
jgi:uridine kinase